MKKPATKPNPSHAQPGTNLPTRFRATCKLKTAVPYDAVPEDVRPLVDADVHTPGRIKSRWHKKLGNVVDLPCDFTTEDAATFEVHMLDVHGRKSSRRGVWSTPSSELPYLAKPMWGGPRLLEEGKPWTEDPKRPRTRTCEGCGTVYEIGVEHETECRDAA